MGAGSKALPELSEDNCRLHFKPSEKCKEICMQAWADGHVMTVELSTLRYVLPGSSSTAPLTLVDQPALLHEGSQTSLSSFVGQPTRLQALFTSCCCTFQAAKEQWVVFVLTSIAQVTTKDFDIVPSSAHSTWVQWELQL